MKFFSSSMFTPGWIDEYYRHIMLASMMIELILLAYIAFK